MLITKKSLLLQLVLNSDLRLIKNNTVVVHRNYDLAGGSLEFISTLMLQSNKNEKEICNSHDDQTQNNNLLIHQFTFMKLFDYLPIQHNGRRIRFWSTTKINNNNNNKTNNYDCTSV